MKVQRMGGVNTFNVGGWVKGGRTLGLVHELFESGVDFFNSTIEMFLDVENVIIQFLIGFFLLSGSHLGMRGGSIVKQKVDK
jgi:hypothetical protein